jgi:uncharacterized protein YdeI (YjbR/CyaY-like superfamily)
MEVKEWDGQPVVAFATEDAFGRWLAGHEGSAGLWVKLGKKGAAARTISYAQAVDVALCHGWIDGQKRAMDKQYWLQRFTPRRSRSRWSKLNCAKAEALIGTGRMQAAGLREVAAAQADGRWDAAYPGQAVAAVPEDLQEALDGDAEAAAYFATLDRRNRYAILYRVHEAKRPETRRRRIATFVAMLHEHETFYPVPSRKAVAGPGATSIED